MKRVIFDTNVYGFLFKEPDLRILEHNMVSDENFIVYGYTQIRKEIRKIPKKTDMSKKARSILLSLYDSITKGRILEHIPYIEELAKSYHSTYKELGGIYSWDTSIKVDFELVACASVNCLDIIYSADKKTMTSTPALRAYKKVNAEIKINTPEFIGYKKLIEDFRNHHPTYRLTKKLL